MRKKKKKVSSKHVIKLRALNRYLIRWAPKPQRYYSAERIVKYYSLDSTWSFDVENAKFYSTKKAAEDSLLQIRFLERL